VGRAGAPVTAARIRLAVREAKNTKKLAKAHAKAEKKAAKAAKSALTASGAGTQVVSSASASERSAAAAERQVRLQKFRVWIALITAIIGLAALFAALL